MAELLTSMEREQVQEDWRRTARKPQVKAYHEAGVIAR